MVSSKAATVADYLAALPLERRQALEAVREVVLGNLPLEVIGGAIATLGVEEFVAQYQASR